MTFYLTLSLLTGAKEIAYWDESSWGAQASSRSPRVREIARQTQIRLCPRFRRIATRGKKSQVWQNGCLERLIGLDLWRSSRSPDRVL